MQTRPIYAEESDLRTIGRLLGMIALCCVGFGLLLVVPLGVMAYSLDCQGGPQNEVLQRVTSPDGRLQAVVFSQTPYEGPTTTEVSIIRPWDGLSDDGGNVFSSAAGSAPLTGPNGGPVVSVTWTGPDRLSITSDPRSSIDRSQGSIDVRVGLLRHDLISIRYGRSELKPAVKSAFAGSWKGHCSWDGHVAPVSFQVAQFGDIFDWRVEGRPRSIVSDVTLDDHGWDKSTKAHLRIGRDWVAGTLFDRTGMAYKIDVTRSGPTVWQVPVRG